MLGMSLAESLERQWHSQLQQACSDLNEKTRKSIVQWLLGEHPEQLDNLTPERQQVFETGLNFRYRILQQRYLNASGEQAYRNLIQRLGGLMILRQKIQAWVAMSRDRQRQVVDVLEEVIQEMLNSDRYLNQQLQWIAQCTDDKRLQTALTFTTLEEYCLRPIRNQPLLVYRFVNYLKRSQKNGITQIPPDLWVQVLPDQKTTDETEDAVNILDQEVMIQYEKEEYFAEQQVQRIEVIEKFKAYLIEKVDPSAAEWLQLHLQGESQDDIAQKMNLPIKQVYRLREKICYHAVRNFTLKHQPKLVTYWLGNSLSEHQLGLTSVQWQAFWQNLEPHQRDLLEKIKAGTDLATIAKDMNLKTSQVLKEWTDLYFKAQAIRNQSE